MNEDTPNSKTIDHPMEEFFNLEKGTTTVPYVEHPLSSSEITHDSFDSKDVEIEGLFDEVYVKAMEAFNEQSETTTTTDPRYDARNKEVAAQYLNTALSAAKQKASLKQHKDALTAGPSSVGSTTTTNNNLILDRNELLDVLFGGENPADREGAPIIIDPDEYTDIP